MMKQRAWRFALVLTLAAGVCSQALSEDHSHEAGHANEAAGHGPKIERAQLHPAPSYSGRTPIDLKNGIPFNNGTFGLRNQEIEAFASEVIIPGLSAKPYPYSMKSEFIASLQDSVAFIKAAIWNWENSKRPDTGEFRKQAIATMEPKLDSLVSAIKKASNAGQSDWESTENKARQALIDLRATYWSMHKNVRH